MNVARLLDLASRYGIVIAWIVVILVFSVLLPDTFPTAGNFATIFGSQAVLLILTLSLLISLTAGEFDLSFAGVLSVSLVIVGYTNVELGWPIGVSIALALAAGVLIGAVNAFFIVGVGVESIVVTLGSGTLLFGLGIGISNQTLTGVDELLVNASRTRVAGVPLAFYYGLLLTTAIWYVFSYTPLGRYLYFAGAGRDVARLAGIAVNRIRVGALVATSTLSALAGVVLAGTLGASDPFIARGFLLPAFAGAFLGATAITPGRFNPWGTFVAVYFLITGITGLELLGLSSWIEEVFYGGVLIAAVTLARLVGRRETSQSVGRVNRSRRRRRR